MDYLYLILGVLLGYILGKVKFTYKRKLHDKHMTKPPPPPRVRTPIKEGHRRPEFYGYSGGYANVNRCMECGVIALYEDMHTGNPCTDCGGKVVSAGAMRWTKKGGKLQWSKN